MSINTKHMMALDQWFIGGGVLTLYFHFITVVLRESQFVRNYSVIKSGDVLKQRLLQICQICWNRLETNNLDKLQTVKNVVIFSFNIRCLFLSYIAVF